MSVKGVSTIILECLSWQDLARSLFLNKRTLGQVMVFFSKPSWFTNGSDSPNLAYNYDVWEKVYPLFHRAQVVDIMTLPGLSTECNLYWVHDHTHD